jgi:hypothetical protein
MGSCAIDCDSEEDHQPEKHMKLYSIKIISEVTRPSRADKQTCAIAPNSEELHQNKEAADTCAIESDSDCDKPITKPQKRYQTPITPTNPHNNPRRVGSNVSLLSIMLGHESSSKGDSSPLSRSRTIRFAGEAQHGTNKPQQPSNMQHQSTNVPTTPQTQAQLPARRVPTAPATATVAAIPSGELRRSSSHPSFSAHPGVLPMSEEAEVRRLRSREFGAQLCHALYNERRVNIWSAGIRTCVRVDEKEDNRRLSWDLAVTGSWANGW